MNLAKCPTRVKVRLTDVPVPRTNQLRIAELGVRIGAVVTVVQRAGFGGVILNIAGSRVALDHRSAKAIRAEVVA